MNEGTTPIKILILCKSKSLDKGLRASVRHHLTALEEVYEKKDILYLNVADGIPIWLRGIAFDVIVLHTTLLSARYGSAPVFRYWRRKLKWVAESGATTLAFPQDDYYHSEILQEWLSELGVKAVFSVFSDNKKQMELLYGNLPERMEFHKCLTGYIHEKILPAIARRPIAERPLDIVYRSKTLPYSVGRHGQLKSVIAEKAKTICAKYGLKYNISVRDEDTMVGDMWFDFLSSGRVVIGSEGGSSVLDRRGEIRERVSLIGKMKGGKATYKEVSDLMPEGWDEYEFFALGPRHLEAIATGTCQVLVEGNYSDVLQPGIHYIPIKKDLSNLEQVLTRLDDGEIAKVAERAYKDILVKGEYTYRHFAKYIGDVIERLNRDGDRNISKPNMDCLSERLWLIAKWRSRLYRGNRGIMHYMALIRLFIAVSPGLLVEKMKKRRQT